MSAPWAEVIGVTGKTVTIRCPYCQAAHQHTVTALGLTERFAPGCGMYRSADDRATGYRFTTTRKAHPVTDDQLTRADVARMTAPAPAGANPKE